MIFGETPDILFTPIRIAHGVLVMAADPLRVKELFGVALEITDPNDRDAFLDRECRADPDLRKRLAVLLQAHDHPESVLERPFAVPAATVTIAPDEPTANYPHPEIAGTLFSGRYKLLDRIGEGGMGEVWVADQQAPIRRRVALKLIKPGIDSRAVLARFEAERQALALMDHPNIAKVLDAGTTDDGRPYCGTRKGNS
jgi:eukaryotic-like serine/threonine-protein kinase